MAKSYNLTFGIAIPLTALVLKKGRKIHFIMDVLSNRKH